MSNAPETSRHLAERLRSAVDHDLTAEQVAEEMVLALLPDADALAVVIAGVPQDVFNAAPDGTLAAFGRLLPNDLWRDARAVLAEIRAVH